VALAAMASGDWIARHSGQPQWCQQHVRAHDADANPPRRARNPRRRSGQILIWRRSGLEGRWQSPEGSL